MNQPTAEEIELIRHAANVCYGQARIRDEQTVPFIRFVQSVEEDFGINIPQIAVDAGFANSGAFVQSIGIELDQFDRIIVPYGPVTFTEYLLQQKLLEDQKRRDRKAYFAQKNAAPIRRGSGPPPSRGHAFQIRPNFQPRIAVPQRPSQPHPTVFHSIPLVASVGPRAAAFNTRAPEIVQFDGNASSIQPGMYVQVANGSIHYIPPIPYFAVQTPITDMIQARSMSNFNRAVRELVRQHQAALAQQHADDAQEEEDDQQEN